MIPSGGDANGPDICERITIKEEGPLPMLQPLLPPTCRFFLALCLGLLALTLAACAHTAPATIEPPPQTMAVAQNAPTPKPPSAPAVEPTKKLSTSGKLSVGQPIPPLAGLDDTSSPLGLAQFFPANACVLISFFQRTCLPCQAGLKELEQRQADLARQKIQVLLVNVAETRSAVSAFRQERGITFPVIMDKYRANADEFGVESLPRSFLVKSNLGLLAIYGEEGNDFVDQVLQDCRSAQQGGSN
jgi:peroxiredoxin